MAALASHFAWQAQHLEPHRGTDVRSGVRMTPPALRGRCSTLCTCASFCVAGAALSPLASHFVWQAQHLEPHRGSDVRSGVRMTPPVLRGSTCVSFCVAGAALGASQGQGCTLWRPDDAACFAWQVQHFVHLCLILRGRCSTFSTCVSFCVAGAALGASCASFCVAGAALGASQGQ